MYINKIKIDKFNLDLLRSYRNKARRSDAFNSRVHRPLTDDSLIHTHYKLNISVIFQMLAN